MKILYCIFLILFTSIYVFPQTYLDSVNIVEDTYHFKDISNGYFINHDIQTLLIGYELYDKRNWAIDLIFGNQLIGLSFDKRLTSIFEFKIGLSTIWYDNKDIKFGFNFLFTKF